MVKLTFIHFHKYVYTHVLVLTCQPSK